MLPDGSALFFIDITLVGTAGMSSTVTVDGIPTAVVFSDCSFTGVPVSPISGNVNIVTSPTSFDLDGVVETENGNDVELVNFGLSGTTSGNQLAGATNAYLFSVPSGSNSTITPTKDINDCNGIDVLDVLTVQLHILGNPANQLPTPYRLIAADVNNDETVDVIDRLIFASDGNFYNRLSWSSKQYLLAVCSCISCLSEPTQPMGSGVSSIP